MNFRWKMWVLMSTKLRMRHFKDWHKRGQASAFAYQHRRSSKLWSVIGVMIHLHRTFELSHHTQKFPKVQVQSSPKNCLNFANRGILALKEITSKRQEARFGILLESRVTASVGTWLRQTRRRGTTRCLTRRRTTRWAGQKVDRQAGITCDTGQPSPPSHVSTL